MARPEVLIEKWFPMDVIGAESMRERGASSALPPLYFLHVWWARRPLTTSRAAILASVLPAWSEGWPKHLRSKFPSEESYRKWFLKLCGIFGDPVLGRKRIEAAKTRGERLKVPPYNYKRAFTVSPSEGYLDILGDLLEFTWGKRQLSILDSFAGGGSIPFEALRYGFKTYANELNPVASILLKATLEYPLRYGTALAEDIKRYGNIIAEGMRTYLEPFFPNAPGESVYAYLWSRTVSCPYTGKPIPLSPNWWLRKDENPIAVRPIFDPNLSEAKFEIVQGVACSSFDPEKGTVRRGNAVSPWALNQPVDGTYIKAEASAGRMGQQLYALAIKTDGGLTFRLPTPKDLYAATAAAREFEDKLPAWQVANLIPDEAIPYGHRSHERDKIISYGVTRMRDFFAPRQLLSLCAFAEELKRIRSVVQTDMDTDRAEAVLTYLALVGDKSADYNSRFMRWDGTRNKIANTFDRHDFSFKWSHGEFDAAHNLFPWALSQVVDAYSGVAGLARPQQSAFTSGAAAQLTLTQGNAASLSNGSGLVDHIAVDPPYYNNVNYAELSDFFLVWLRRNLGDIFPDILKDQLANRDDEAVANPARFHQIEASPKKRMALANADYERKMAASFREMYRVLSDDGVLTIMFTHKNIEAWDTLATSLIGSGFAIQSSWPVHTESEHSLHQAKKNAAQSTILLTCRKREGKPEPVWWDDLREQVRRTAREGAQEFEKQGIRGVDLYIATFGPTLAILSENWPVLTSEMNERTGEPLPLRPEVALDLARQEVIGLRKQGLLLGRTVRFDSHTDWYLMAWDAFRAEQFPADEARKLALALGLDPEREVVREMRLISKKGANVIIQQPIARRRRGLVDPERSSFEHWIDAAHTAMLIHQEDGTRACEHFLRRTGLLKDGTFRALVQALINAIPRTRKKDKFIRPEAETLEAMRLAFFDDIEPPPEEEVPLNEVQRELFQISGDEEDRLYEEEQDQEDEEDL